MHTYRYMYVNVCICVQDPYQLPEPSTVSTTETEGLKCWGFRDGVCDIRDSLLSSVSWSLQQRSFCSFHSNSTLTALGPLGFSEDSHLQTTYDSSPLIGRNPIHFYVILK